ncbi:MAG: tRNA (adenosine(37)-N6)-dimethylallyltransferase MiaA [Lachnospiraceae bacterium]|jgi:tRNA dimethylallyltransferase|nr:tRNA (adenosine(37)-N6)-dimethylallyltransferase MiaA [Lachnospiraceae bacterium]
MKQPFVILTGPTASGKTALSVALAKRIGGEIISADSMQVYRGMDIGSAKVTKEEMQGVRHHLIDVLEPDEPFHVVIFQELAKKALAEIYAAGHIPIVAGGTGFYIQALLYDIDFTENDGDMEYRKRLEALAEDKGPGYLHELLQKADPGAAAAIHPHNTKRIIRALEFHEKTGEKISIHNETERAKESPYAFVYYVLNMGRSRLYERIETRVDKMITDGLVEEVSRLRGRGCTRELVSMQGLGYKEILDYLDGVYTLEEAVRLIKRDTRHFAKRQLTWFRRERDVTWLEQEEFGFDNETLLEWIVSDLKSRGIYQ